MRRRSGDRMTRTNRTRKGAVGTVKKSIEAHCGRCVRRNVDPGRRRRRRSPAKVLGDGRLGDLNAQLLEVAVNARGAPEGVRAMHLLNQSADVSCDRRSTETGCAER